MVEDVVSLKEQALHISYGSWSVTTNTTALAIHAALMPTSTWASTSDAKVLYFGGSQHDPALPFGKNSWRQYNASTDVVTTLSFNTEDAFCSGHAHMKDGKLLIVGGNQYYAGASGFVGEIPDNLAPTAMCNNPDLPAINGRVVNIHKCSGHFAGARNTYAFDFMNNSLTALPSTARGRWYPTVSRIFGPNESAQMLTIAGHIGASDPAVGGSHDNPDIETLSSTSSGWTIRTNLPTTDHYPRIHLVPRDLSFFTSTAFGSVVVGFSNQGTAGAPLNGGPPPGYQGIDTSSVLLPLRPSGGVYPNGRVMVTNQPQYAVIDLAAASPVWNATVPRPVPAAGGSPRRRLHANATLLSTGDVLVSGGYENPGDENTAVRYTEIYREDLNVWHEGPSATVGRNYHSTALLLPDGRVWTAGGNKRAGYAQTNQPNGDGRELRIEVFRPWYMSLSRPAIASGTSLTQPPSSGSWRINTASGTTGTSITRVALIAPGSVTHSFNVDQRYVQLAIASSTSTSVTVTVPSSRSVLPSGFYLLVISRSSNGNAAGSHVPSVARWVRIP